MPVRQPPLPRPAATPVRFRFDTPDFDRSFQPGGFSGFQTAPGPHMVPFDQPVRVKQQQPCADPQQLQFPRVQQQHFHGPPQQYPGASQSPRYMPAPTQLEQPAW
jgi:hypothetical protein